MRSHVPVYDAGVCVCGCCELLHDSLDCGSSRVPELVGMEEPDLVEFIMGHVQQHASAGEGRRSCVHAAPILLLPAVVPELPCRVVLCCTATAGFAPERFGCVVLLSFCRLCLVCMLRRRSTAAHACRQQSCVSRGCMWTPLLSDY
jgi:hypothetical protein